MAQKRGASFLGYIGDQVMQEHKPPADLDLAAAGLGDLEQREVYHLVPRGGRGHRPRLDRRDRVGQDTRVHLGAMGALLGRTPGRRDPRSSDKLPVLCGRQGAGRSHVVAGVPAGTIAATARLSRYTSLLPFGPI